MQDLKAVIAANISGLRRRAGLTQLGLAERLNYSDKAVSKWERGEAIPDVATLKQIADLFGVTVDLILTPGIDLAAVPSPDRQRSNKIIIAALAVSVIWIFATIFFVYSTVYLGWTDSWKTFVWAVPASCLLLNFFNRRWGRPFYSLILVSLFLWTLLTGAFLQAFPINTWMVYLLGIPIQISVVLWSKLRKA